MYKLNKLLDRIKSILPSWIPLQQNVKNVQEISNPEINLTNQIDWKSKNPRDVERMLSPVRFIAGEDKQKIIDDHFNNAQRETELARSQLSGRLDIPYGAGDSDKLDIYYGPSESEGLTGAKPILVWVHGGGWLAGDKMYAYHIRNVTSWGYNCISIGYKLAPEAGMQEMVESILRALETSMELFPNDGFILAGHSAGAQLIANLLCWENRIWKRPELIQRIKGFLLISGLYDLRSVQNTIMNGALELTDKISKTFCPVLNTSKIPSIWLNKRDPLKILISCGEFDPPEFIRQSKVLHKGLIERGFRPRDLSYWEAQGDNHLSVIENLKNANSNVSLKLKEFLENCSESGIKSKL